MVWKAREKSSNHGSSWRIERDYAEEGRTGYGPQGYNPQKPTSANYALSCMCFLLPPIMLFYHESVEKLSHLLYLRAHDIFPNAPLLTLWIECFY